MGLVVAAGVGLCFVPGGAVLGVGMLIGAGTSTAFGVATGHFNPRMAAFNGLLGGLTAGVGDALSGASIATQVIARTGIGAGDSLANQVVQGGPISWKLVGIGAGLGSLAGGVAGKLSMAEEVNGGSFTGKAVIVDTNALTDRSGVMAALGPGETPVVTGGTVAELRNIVTRGSIKMPAFAHELPSIPDVMDVNTRINIRGSLADIAYPQKGILNDGTLGATAVNRGLPVITKDARLTRVLTNLGVDVRNP
jgi:hypothetical protein